MYGGEIIHRHQLQKEEMWIQSREYKKYLFKNHLLNETVQKYFTMFIGFMGFPVAQMVQNPPAMWKTWVRSLGWEDVLEQGMTTHSSILAWRIPMNRGIWQSMVHGVAKSQCN